MLASSTARTLSAAQQLQLNRAQQHHLTHTLATRAWSCVCLSIRGSTGRCVTRHTVLHIKVIAASIVIGCHYCKRVVTEQKTCCNSHTDHTDTVLDLVGVTAHALYFGDGCAQLDQVVQTLGRRVFAAQSGADAAACGTAAQVLDANRAEFA
eukprot:13190-Heterococcus_DN1.PRE.3